jgi:Flp pilus assembly protein TadD
MSGRFRQFCASAQRRLPAARWLLLGAAVLAAGSGAVAWLLRPDPDRVAAERAIERRDYATAYDHLEECVKRRPHDARFLFLAARTARRAAHYEQAEEHLRACQRLEGPTDAIALERALIRAQQGDSEVESYLLARVSQGDPDTLLIWEVLIQQYLDTYQLFKARDCLDRYLERRPDDVQALLGRGFVWERLFFYPEAVDDYRRAVQVEPENDRARLRLAETLLITGPPDQAAEQFEELRWRHPDSRAARIGLARAWRRQGRTAEAGQLLDALLAEDANEAGALTERGLASLDEGDAAGAETALRRAVALAPADPEALHNLCQCLRLRGRDDELRDYQACFDRLDADLKRLAQVTNAVLKAPHDPALRCEAGVLFLRTGEEQEGVRWLNLALHEAPGYRPAHQALADYYQRTGRSDLAGRHRRLTEAAGQTQKSPGSESGSPE